MSRNKTSDICFGFLRMILLTGGAWPQNAAAPADGMHQPGEWTTHAHDAQHTGVSPVASQKLATIHWQVPVDLAPPEVLLPTRETSFVLPRYATFAELSSKVKKERKRYLDVTRGTADLDNVFESRMKGSARIN
jgi:hypothetical protein